MHTFHSLPAPRITGELRPGGRGQGWEQAGCEGAEAASVGQKEGREGCGAGWGSSTAGAREARRRGMTHCSSSRQRRHHSPRTGCSDWSSQCRYRPGSGTRPHCRPSLEQCPPSTVILGPPRGVQGGPARAPSQSAPPTACSSALNQTPPRLGPEVWPGGGGAEVQGPRLGRAPLTVTGNLIGTIPAVIHSVAPQHVGHTASVVALAKSLLAAAGVCGWGADHRSAATTAEGLHLRLMGRHALFPASNCACSPCSGPGTGFAVALSSMSSQNS